MVANCPKCGSKYINIHYTYRDSEGIHTTFACQSCKYKWETLEKWANPPKGKWLMTLMPWNHEDDYVLFFKEDSGNIIKWQIDARYLPVKTEVLRDGHCFGVYQNDSHYNVDYHAPRTAHVVNYCRSDIIKINSDLAKLALQNEATKMFLKTTKKGEIFLDIGGERTKSLPLVQDIAKWLNDMTNGSESVISKSEGGCYIATAVYGTYDCPELWTLRRYRDTYLAKYLLGRGFIKLYYSTSPSFVRLFGKNKWFTKVLKTVIDKIVRYLNNKGYSPDYYID